MAKGDLISRSALLKQLLEAKDDEAIKAVIGLVQTQPTTYDVEQVVKELKEWSFETEIVIPTSDGSEDTANREIICTLNAIDIVRKGGAE